MPRALLWTSFPADLNWAQACCVLTCKHSKAPLSGPGVGRAIVAFGGVTKQIKTSLRSWSPEEEERRGEAWPSSMTLLHRASSPGPVTTLFNPLGSDPSGTCSHEPVKCPAQGPTLAPGMWICGGRSALPKATERVSLCPCLCRAGCLPSSSSWIFPRAPPVFLEMQRAQS